MTTAAVDDIFRVYLDPSDIRADGYPYVWTVSPSTWNNEPGDLPIKDLVRERDGHRCLRCRHPYTKGNPLNSPRSEWSPCGEQCSHGEPTRVAEVVGPGVDERIARAFSMVEAQWRILTVHHLNGVKHDCRWWNLVSLCQRCHLTIQGRVIMERPWTREHSEWFKPFAAAYYASLNGEELTRAQVDARLEEILELQFTQPSFF